MAYRPTHIFLHTAAHGKDGADYDTTAAQINDWHLARGWDGIGYHYVVRKSGTIERGRPLHKQGAHVGSEWNHKSIGICFSGHGDISPWTGPQWASGLCLVWRLMQAFCIGHEHVLGHREMGAPKTCPGTLVDMDEVRASLVRFSVAVEEPIKNWMMERRG